MIDDKKIEEAARDYINKNGYFVKYDEDPCVAIELAYKEGAKWAIDEFLKDLCHPVKEVPRNDNGKVLAYSKEIGYRKLYDMNAMLDKTTCNTYQEMWEEQVNILHLSDWIFVEELFDLITKGGENEGA